MRGMDLARRYCAACAPGLLAGLPEGLDRRIALGLVGAGSECLGFDDELSRDHDFGPGFCIWLGEEDHRRFGAELQRRYDALPPVFGGLERVETEVAGKRVGVFAAASFFAERTGLMRPARTAKEWISIPDQLLAEAAGGEVFDDPGDVVGPWRRAYAGGYPDQVMRKKVAANAAAMAQAGQHNLPRCLRRGDLVAADLARSAFLLAAIACLHLLARVYTPFYKWAFRSLRERAGAPERVVLLIERIASAPVAEVRGDDIEVVCAFTAQVLVELGWSGSSGSFLLTHARDICRKISDPHLASLPIAAGAYRP